MVVMKFGGSSVATPAALAHVRTIVEAERRPRVVIVSALGGVTDALLALAGRAASRDLDSALATLQGLRDRHAAVAAGVRANAGRRALLTHLGELWQDVETLLRAVSLLGACPPAASDAIVAHGELASSRLVAAILNDAGLRAGWVDARSVVVTDERHQSASPLAGETAERLSRIVEPLIQKGAIPVLGGFIGATRSGATTTLGRGGSDYSASLVGACLGAGEIQIWTDVDGMLTADPRVFTGARRVERLSFAEAAALARFGAKVLHPSTVRPATLAGIPVRILNTRRQAGRGTVITEGPVRRPALVAGLACLQNLCAFEVDLPDGGSRSAGLAAVFDACARAEAAVHLAAVSDSGVSVVTEDGPAADRVAELWGSERLVSRRKGLALVAAVGDSLALGAGVAASVLAECDATTVHFLSRTPGANHVALVVDQARLSSVVATLHERLVERRARLDAPDEQPRAAGVVFPAYGPPGQEVRA
jgi:aspartate kinase